MDLAIIIPAYKINYFEEALKSLVNQTNKSFNVYVGDDCSKDDLKSICDKYSNQISLGYYRFENNLGETNLVKHWERCVNLMGNEKWLWLFSDDDVLEENCVEKFYDTLIETNGYYDVYRFNTCIINSAGKIVSISPESPTHEDSLNLALNILMGKRGNSMPDHIFKKEKYIELSGFIDFPYGQASDWATSIEYAIPKGLYTISGPKVRWRYSGVNISSSANKNKHLLIQGYIQFQKWINCKFIITNSGNIKFPSTDIKFAAWYNFELIIRDHYQGIPYSSFFKIARTISAIYEVSNSKAMTFCLSLNLSMQRDHLKKIFCN